MGLLRLAWRLPPLLLFMVTGTLLIFATSRYARVREPVVTGFCRGLLRTLGVRVTVRGQPGEGTALVVANHVSWLDVILLQFLWMVTKARCTHRRHVARPSVRTSTAARLRMQVSGALAAHRVCLAQVVSPTRSPWTAHREGWTEY